MNGSGGADGAEFDWAAVPTAGCPIGLAVGVIGDRWSLLLLRELAFGVDRFDAVQEHLGVSRRTLTERLDALVQAGVARRVPYKEAGQRTRHRYELTGAGSEVLPLLVALAAWGERYRATASTRPDGEPPSADRAGADLRSPLRMHHAGCGRTVLPRLLCTAGHEVPAAEIEPRLRRTG